jgi:hypothetical protein
VCVCVCVSSSSSSSSGSSSNSNSNSSSSSRCCSSSSSSNNSSSSRSNSNSSISSSNSSNNSTHLPVPAVPSVQRCGVKGGGLLLLLLLHGRVVAAGADGLLRLCEVLRHRPRAARNGLLGGARVRPVRVRGDERAGVAVAVALLLLLLLLWLHAMLLLLMLLLLLRLLLHAVVLLLHALHAVRVCPHATMSRGSVERLSPAVTPTVRMWHAVAWLLVRGHWGPSAAFTRRNNLQDSGQSYGAEEVYRVQCTTAFVVNRLSNAYKAK